jgi:hypothetical protein
MREGPSPPTAVKFGRERFDTRPFQSWIKGLQLESVPLTRDGVFLQKHVSTGEVVFRLPAVQRRLRGESFKDLHIFFASR